MSKDNCECGTQLPDCVLTARMVPDSDINLTKPWHSWPHQVEKMFDYADNQRLRHYMSCPEILRKLHYETRLKAKESLRSLAGNGSYVIMQGGLEHQWSFYQSDTLVDIFKQEQFFRYMFGADIPDCYGVYDIDNEQFYLFVPEVPASARPYVGDSDTNQQIKNQWKLDNVHYTKHLESFIKTLDSESSSPKKKCYILEGINNDSGIKTKNTPTVSDFNLTAEIDRQTLYKILEECRVVKGPREQEMLRVAAWISSLAHVAVMKQTVAGHEELYHEALFKSVCAIVGGARNVAYNCICAAKTNAAILHYGHATKPNNGFLKNGDLVLHDMGGMFPSGYVADITVTYPVGGKFSPDQKIIYDAVLEANKKVQKSIRPGADWIGLHKMSEVEVLKGLRNAGIIKDVVTDDKLEELMEKRLGAFFMPHGLGHLIGLDVHDCGGHDHKRREEMKAKRGLANVRVTRDLLAGMYITVEPGCYFIDYLMKELKETHEFKQYINLDRLDEFADMGGVRIEDDVVVTENGCINFTVVPRTTEDIEAILS